MLETRQAVLECYSKSRFCKFLAIIQLVDAEVKMSGLAAIGGGAFVESECRRIAAFGEACGSGVHDEHVAEVLFEFPDVRVPVKVNVNLRFLFCRNFEFYGLCGTRRFYAFHRISRETFWHKDMPVAQEQVKSIIFDDCIFVFDGEVEHHQINFGIAVAADGDNAFFVRRERFDNAHGAVPCRERIPRTVIKRIAEQEYLVAVELFKER